MTAQWLEGRLAEHPGYPGGPDPETAPLVPTLAAVNRAGYLTISSQPGTQASEPGGAWWRQRAAVTGFASNELGDRIADAAAAAGLLVIAHHGCRRWWDWRATGVTVTTCDGEPCTWFGPSYQPKQTSTSAARCRPTARRTEHHGHPLEANRALAQ